MAVLLAPGARAPREARRRHPLFPAQGRTVASALPVPGPELACRAGRALSGTPGADAPALAAQAPAQGVRAIKRV